MNVWRRNFFHYKVDEDGGGAPPVPGTGEAVPGQSDDSSAGTQTTDTQTEAPGPVPYTRFQEVNNRAKELNEAIQPYRAIEDLGYGADDFHRLASWEQEFIQDPVTVWLDQAGKIDGLPDEVMAAITAAKGNLGSADTSPPQLTNVTPPAPDDDLRTKVDELYNARQAAEAEAQAAREAEAVSGFYDGIVKVWQDMDVKQGFVNEKGESATPERSMHAFIQAASVNAESAEQLLREAREGFLADREQMLGAVVKSSRDGVSVPRPVPGSGQGVAGASPPPTRATSLREATRRATADAEAGLLVPLE